MATNHKESNQPDLVVQWLRILLLMKGTCVQSLVWEDLTCHRETKPVHHTCCTPQQESSPHSLHKARKTQPSHK